MTIPHRHWKSIKPLLIAEEKLLTFFFSARIALSRRTLRHDSRWRIVAANCKTLWKALLLDVIRDHLSYTWFSRHANCIAILFVASELRIFFQKSNIDRKANISFNYNTNTTLLDLRYSKLIFRIYIFIVTIKVCKALRRIFVDITL